MSRLACGCLGTPDDCCSLCWHRWRSDSTDGEGFLVVAEWARPAPVRPAPVQLALVPLPDRYGTATLDC